MSAATLMKHDAGTSALAAADLVACGSLEMSPDRVADVQAVAAPALRHRIILNFEGEAEGISTDSVVRAIIAETPTEPAE